jgi:hypothetical protein
VNQSAIAQALRAQAQVLEALAKVLETPSSASNDAIYDSNRLPPGAQSWRAVLEAGRRGELKVTRVGRKSVVHSDAWLAYVESKNKSRRVGPAIVKTSDEERLAKMGIVLPK